MGRAVFVRPFLVGKPTAAFCQYHKDKKRYNHEMVNTILDFSKIEVGKLEIVENEYDLSINKYKEIVEKNKM